MVTKLFIVFYFLLSCENTEKKNSESPIIWESHYQKANFESSFPTYSDWDSMIFLARDAHMIAYNAITGEEKWRYQYDYADANVLEVNVVDEKYIYATPWSEFVVLKHDGSRQFKSTGHLLGYRRIPYLNENYYYMIKDAKIKRYNKGLNSEEEVVEKYKETSIIFNFAIEDNIIFLSCIGGSRDSKEEATGGLYAIDMDTRELVWKYEVESGNSLGYWRQTGFKYPSLVYGDNVIAFANSDVGFPMICFNKNTGVEKWRTEWISVDQRPPMIDSIICAFTHNAITAVDANTGKILWKNEFGFATTAYTYAYKGYFYFVDLSSGALHVLEPRSGKKLYTYSLHNGLNHKTVGFGDDKVFVNGYDRLYALKAYHMLNN